MTVYFLSVIGSKQKIVNINNSAVMLTVGLCRLVKVETIVRILVLSKLHTRQVYAVPCQCRDYDLNL